DRDEYRTTLYNTIAVVLRAALTAKDQRKKYRLAVSGHELLAMNRDVPFIFGLYRGVNRVSTANELMETKCKRGKAGLGIWLTTISAEEPRLNRNRALLSGQRR